MLSFGLSAFLWFALALVPLAVFYFLRLRFKRRLVGSTYLWQKVADKFGGGKRLRLRSVLLFLVQAGAIVCAVLAGALPAFNSRQLTKPGLALLVDSSASMSAQETGKSRMELAVDAAKAKLKSVAADVPVVLFALSDDARLVAGPASPIAISAALGGLRAESKGFAEEKSAATLRAWLVARSDSWSALLISDGGTMLGGRALSAAFDKELTVTQVGEGEENIGLSGLRLVQNRGQGSEATIARFTVRNGYEGQRELSLKLSRDGKDLAAFTVAVPRGVSEQDVPVNTYAETGAYTLSLVSSLAAPGAAASDASPAPGTANEAPDRLAVDNQTYLAINEPQKIRVLAIGAQNPYLDAAFNYPGIDYASSDSLPEKFNAREWDLVVFDHVLVPDKLETNVLSFGSLSRDSGFAFGDELSGNLNSVDSTHPLGRFLQWEGVGTVTGRALNPVGASASERAIAAINGQAVIVAWEKDGHRRAASSVDLFGSGFGLSGAFPVFVRNLLLWIAPQSDDQLEYTLNSGETVTRSVNADWHVLEADKFSVSSNGGSFAITPKEPGIFHWATKDNSGFIAVNPPAEESDLKPQTLRVPEAPGNLVSSENESQLPLETVFLILLFGCLVAEWILWRGLPGERRKKQTTGASPAPSFAPATAVQNTGSAGADGTADKMATATGSRLRSGTRFDLAQLRVGLAAFFARFREWFGVGKRLSDKLGLLRLIVLAVAIVALAGISLPLPHSQRNLAILIDVSDSMGRAAIEQARGLGLKALGELESGDRAALVLFAGQARLASGLLPPAEMSDELNRVRLEAPDPEASDIGAATALAKRVLVDESGNSEILLLSDGRANTGSDSSGLDNIKVRAIALGQNTTGIVSDSLALPEIVHPGENVVARWQFNSDKNQTVNVKLMIDDNTAIQERIDVGEGLQEIGIPLQVAESGSHVLKVLVSRPDGQAMPAGTIGAVVQAGAPAAVLVVRGGDSLSPLVKSLQTQGMQVREAASDGLPDEPQAYSGLSAVVLDNVSALKLSNRQMDELETYVLGGGGLFVLGGDESLARGAYYDTSIEHMLPVSTDTRRRLLFARNKILFVIDQSGSMSDEVGGVSKRLAAMRGVADSIRNLRAQDEVGIMGFDTEVHWIAPFTSVEHRDDILNALAATGEGGGTNIGVAMQEMVTAFGAPGPVRRHAVLITDGQTPDADFKGLAEALSSANVTLSTIGIGQDVNEELLKNIADWAGGAYYRADVDRIPRIIDNETVRITREAMREGSFPVTVADDQGMTAGLPGRMPNIKGYMLVDAKPRAQVLMSAQDPVSPNKIDPLLVTWRYGNGQVAVFASDSGSRWLGSWVGTAAYQRLWGQVIRGIERGSTDSGMRVTALLDGGRARLAVDAISGDRSLRSGLQLSAHVAGDDSSWFELKETAPGHYEGDTGLGTSGVLRFEVTDSSGQFRSISSWLWVPSGVELSRTGPDYDALGKISGGADLLDPAGTLVDRGSVVWSLSPIAAILIAALILLFLVEMGMRSTAFGQLGLALAAFRTWWSGQQSVFRKLAAPPRSMFDDGPSDAAQKRVGEAYLYLAKSKKAAQDQRAETAPGKDRSSGKST